MSSWDPDRYRRYAAERDRPALDLVARVNHPAPRSIVDLGCGTGELVRALADRWPEARLVGLDLSAEMLAKARAAGAPDPRAAWVRADLARWRPRAPVDVLVSNAVLQWLPGHRELAPRLFEQVAPGGTLAFQVPLSHGEPLLTEMRALLRTGGPGGGPLGAPEVLAAADRPWVLAPEEYGDLLAPLAREVDVWETRYHHRLRGPDAVLEWVSGTALRPVLQGLGPSDRERFLAAYRARLREHYPPRPDGTTVLPFPRLFVVARR